MSETPRPRTLRDSLVPASQSADVSRDAGQESAVGIESWIAWLGRAAILVAVLLPPWMFGGVTAQAQWLISLAMLVALGCWWIELTIRRGKTQTVVPYVGAFVLMGLLLGWTQTFGLPNGLASRVLGRQNELYPAYLGPLLGDASAIRPRASLNVEATWNQLRLMFLGAMGLITGCQFFRRPKDLVVLLSAITINGVVLAFFGIIHRFTTNGKLYWMFELSQGGQPFGPFVNRNNAAGYLLLCLAGAIGLLVYLWLQRQESGPDLIVSKEIPIWRQIGEHVRIQLAELTTAKLAVLLAAMFIAAAIFVTLSRGGVTALLAGFVITTIFFGMARKPRIGALLIFPILVGIAVLTSWIGFNDVLVERFGEIVKTDEFTETDVRIRTWSESSQSVRAMGALGAGLGTFPIVQRLYSSQSDPGVFEYAENQFVQAMVDGGVIALLILVLAVGLFSSSSLFLLNRGVSASSVAVGTLGVNLASSQVVASFFDFGWYVPANTILLAVLVGVCSQYIHAFAARLKKKSWLRFQVPNYATHVLVLVSFSVCVVLSLSLYRFMQVERYIDVRLPAKDSAKLDLAATEEKIKAIAAVGGGNLNAAQCEYLGDLWVHRARLLIYQQMPTINRRTFWDQTEPMRLLEHVVSLRNDRGQGLANEFMRQPFVTECLPTAVGFYRESLLKHPFQADVLMKLAVLLGIFGETESATEFARRAVDLEPNDVAFNTAASCLLLFVGKRDESVPYLRKVLELDPRQFVGLISFVQGLTGRLSQPLSNAILAEQVLPNNPRVLFDFVKRYLPKDSPLRSDLLRRGVELIGDHAYVEYNVLLLKINMLMELEDWEQAAEMLKIAVDTRPTERGVRYRYATLLLRLERYDEAMRQARRLLSEEDSPKHKKLYEDLQKLNERRLLNQNK